ncbi:MAG: 50S ribosomal protein L2 [Candidatus Micrarchaeota archaeon]
MGKFLQQQRRGKGSPAYTSPSHRYKVDLSYRVYDEVERNSVLKGEIVDFVDDPGRDAILMKIRFENNEELLLLAPEGAKVGENIELGKQAKIGSGNVLPLSQIPDGSPVYAIESVPGDGGKFVRAAGSAAFVVSHEGGVVTVRLPSKKVRIFPPDCRAQIGIICGGGRLEKPMMTAGANFHKMGARNRLWPVVRGVAMNPVSHPFGGSQHHKGKSSTVSRDTPPGRKVGHVAARTMGRSTSQKRLRKTEEGNSK